MPKKKAKSRKKAKQSSASKAPSSPSATAIPEALVVDFTPAFYKATKEHYLKQVPRIARHFIIQYFDFIRKLDPYEVMDWLDKGTSLKDLYEHQPFPERIAIAGARGLIRSSRRIKSGANRAINFDVTCYTLRFENPAVWEVIQAYGEEALDRLRQGIEDIKEILKLKEAA